MVSFRLLKYIKSNIEEDYSLEVLYYCLRKGMELHDFSLTSFNFIRISEKFLPGSVAIDLNSTVNDQISSFALLLSLRAIILDRSLIDICKTDNLIFEQKESNHFWLKKTSLILSFLADDDFQHLFQTLEELSDNGSMSEVAKAQFVKDTVKPEYRNLKAYYKSLAERSGRASKEVVCNNAYVTDDSIRAYIIHDEVNYVGDTAFAYCNNLKYIVIENPNLTFGLFPIIECPNLRNIIVPEGSGEYYKKALPYYSIIITENHTLLEDVHEELSSNIVEEDNVEILDNIIPEANSL